MSFNFLEFKTLNDDTTVIFSLAAFNFLVFLSNAKFSLCAQANF